MAEHSKSDAAKKTVHAVGAVGTTAGLGVDLASRTKELVAKIEPFQAQVQRLLHSTKEVSTFMTEHFPKEMSQINQSGELAAMIGVGVLLSLGATWLDKLRVKENSAVKEMLTSIFEVMRTPFLVALPYLLASFPVAIEQMSKGSLEGELRFALTAVSALVGVLEVNHAWHIMTHLGWSESPQQSLTMPITAIGYEGTPTNPVQAAPAEPIPEPTQTSRAVEPSSQPARTGGWPWNRQQSNQVIQVDKKTGQVRTVDPELENLLYRAMGVEGPLEASGD